MERWGALAVKDHTNVRALATDVLLYDKLIVPTPPAWDRNRWEKKGWDPDGLDRRLEKLKCLVYRAGWGEQEQESWSTEFSELVQDANDIGMAPTEEAAMLVTRRRLAQNQRIKHSEGVPPEVVAAFRSEQALLQALNPETQVPLRPKVLRASDPANAEIDIIVGVRLIVPNHDDQEDALAAGRELPGMHDRSDAED